MASDLISLAQGVLNSGVVDQISKAIGEPTAKTQAAVTGAVPSVLAGVLNSVGSSPGGAGQILSALSQGGFDKVLGSLPSMLGGGSGSSELIGIGKQVLGSLFGDKLGGVSGALASSSGVSTSSAGSILAMAAPAVMGLLGRALGSNPSPAGLLGLLASNKDAIARFAPAGLLGALGVKSFDDMTSKAGATLEQAAGAGAKRWVPLAAIAAAVVIGYLAWQNCGQQAQEAKNTATAAAKKLASLTLPGGATLSVEQDTFLYNLARYLGSTDATVPKTFIFDNLNFETGGTTLTAASGPTVTDLTRVLIAYPSAQVKLVGYTDTTGDPAANTALSQARAKAVADLLARGGVPPSRMTTDGMGAANPVASNDSDDGRAKNRRIELVVTQK